MTMDAGHSQPTPAASRHTETDNLEQKDAPLQALVRLLARQAARDFLVSTDPVSDASMSNSNKHHGDQS